MAKEIQFRVRGPIPLDEKAGPREAMYVLTRWGNDLYGVILDGHRLNNLYMQGRLLRTASFEKCEMIGVKLCDADLRDANLRHANLNEADLSRANLQGANLQGCSLHRTKMCGANLHGANLNGSDLYDTDFTGADLTDCDMRGTDLRNSKLDAAKFPGLRITDPTGFVQAHYVRIETGNEIDLD